MNNLLHRGYLVVMALFLSLLLLNTAGAAESTTTDEPIAIDEQHLVEQREVTSEAEEKGAPLRLYAEMETNYGAITIELYADRAPNTVGNFLEYLNESFYDGLIFHRVIDGFMIQGGGFDPSMEQKATRIPVSIESKNGLKNERGTVAMARSSDPNSATSQFFINTVDNAFLDYPGHDGYGYTVFGRVISGMEVVDNISKVETTTAKGHRDVPVEPVLIERLYLIDAPN